MIGDIISIFEENPKALKLVITNGQHVKKINV